MAAFERKTLKLPARGQNWNRPADAIPEEQAALMRNLRYSQEGEITSRPGLSLFCDFAGVSGDIHSISRLNNSHPALALTAEHIIGIGTEIRSGPDASTLLGANNPIALPYLPAGVTWEHMPLSGYPLSFADSTPIGSPFALKYVGDSTQMFSLGRYPGDPAGSMLRANYMGLPPPVNEVVPAASGAIGSGALQGDYQWAFAYRNKHTGARGNPSAATRISLATPLLTLDDQAATFTLPLTPYDPQLSNTQDTHIYVDVYRLGGTINRWVYVGTGNSGEVFTDNFSDDVLQTSSSPPSITDETTGITRFTQYMPFVTQDRACFGNAFLAVQPNGTYRLTVSSGDLFNTRWLPGSYIGVNGGNFSIHQVISTTVLELAEDASGAVEAGAVPWSTPEGTLKWGTPMQHIWGPFSTGTGGSYIFGVGNPEAPGDLYWTNGNDPDSTDVINSLHVTSASEPLINGAMVDGTCLLWSTERMFRVYPSFTVPGQFTVEEVPGGKGLYAPFSLSTQTTPVAEHVTWLSRDGVYNWSISGGLESLSDPAMYPFFIHDNQQPRKLAEIFPWLANETAITAPDFSQAMLRYHRLTWFDGMLFYDFPQTAIAGAGTTYAALVYDSKEAKGWVSIDIHALDVLTFGNGNLGPVSRAFETGGYMSGGATTVANNLKVGCGRKLFDYRGPADNGNPIPCRLITRPEDMGDPRAPKLWGDYILDVAPGGATVSALVRLDYNANSLPAGAVVGGSRQQAVMDFSAGLGVLSPTFALDLTWSATTGQQPFLYQLQPSYVAKPEITHARATDWSDYGEPGDKWVYGALIEANTFGQNRTVEIHGDNDAVLATLTLNHNGQSTKPYSFAAPAITHQLRCVPVEPSTWELFRFLPQFTAKPELTRFEQDWTDDGKPVPKYLQGFVLQGDTGGTDVTVELWADQLKVQTFTVNHAGELEKPYPVTTPPIIHEMRLVPTTGNLRYLDEFKLAWMYVEQPEFTRWVPDYTPSDPTAYHGVAIEADTGGQTISVDVVSEGQVVRTLSVNHDGRIQKTYSFGQPFTSTEIKLVPRGDWRQYPGWKVRWVGYPKPDDAALWSNWTDDGYEGAKFMQGFILQADSAGQTANLTVQYDGGQTAETFPVNHPSEMQKAYSFATPFIAHMLRVVPSSNLRMGDPFKIRWIWEPAPELAKFWHTQTTAHGLPGWFHHRDGYIALQSYDFVNLRITDDSGAANNYSLPSTGGNVQKIYLPLRPQKAKLVSYSVTSPTGFRLFQKDCEMRVAAWSRGTAEYLVTHPFGGPHYERGAFV